MNANIYNPKCTLYMYIHTHMYRNIQICTIDVYIHIVAWIHTYKHTNIHIDLQCIHTYKHTYIHTYSLAGLCQEQLCQTGPSHGGKSAIAKPGKRHGWQSAILCMCVFSCVYILCKEGWKGQKKCMVLISWNLNLEAKGSLKNAYMYWTQGCA
jgi:hypothetical protein